MKKKIVPFFLSAALLLTGCGSFLDRDYSTSTPHSSSYFSSEDPSALRAESYQELVNGLLMLIASHAESGTIRLYGAEDIAAPGDAMENACREVQQDTPLGAYAVEYLTYTIDESAHNYAAVSLTIGYRRSSEQIAATVHATNLSALPDLLLAAADAGAAELVIQVGNFDRTREEVLATVAQVQLQLSGAEAPETEEIAEPWQVFFYPDSDDAGIVEIVLENAVEKNEQMQG